MTQVSKEKLAKTICIGRIISEYVSEQIEDRIEKVKSWELFIGGTAGAVAHGLAKLKCPVSFIGCIGDDSAGQKLTAFLEADGIDIRGLRKTYDAQTGWSWCVRHPNGDRSFYAPQVSYEHLADSQLSIFDIDSDWFQDVKFVIPQSTHLGPDHGREALFYVRELTRKANALLCFVINQRAYAWPDLATAKERTLEYAKSSDITKINLADSTKLFGATTIKELRKILPNNRGIILTKGQGGCEYILDGYEGYLPSYSVKVEDSTGAGCAFFAAFISMLVKHGVDSMKDKDTCETYMRFANAAGAFSVSRMGAVGSLPTELEIEELMQQQS
jgi:fructokinase